MVAVDVATGSVAIPVVAVAGADVGSTLESTGPFVLEGGLVTEVAAVWVDWGGPLCFDETGESGMDVSLLGDVVDVTP